jgi:hypothetical protein
LIDYPPPIRRVYRPRRKPWRSGFDSRHGVPPFDHATCPSNQVFLEVFPCVFEVVFRLHRDHASDTTSWTAGRLGGKSRCWSKFINK